MTFQSGCGFHFMLYTTTTAFPAPVRGSADAIAVAMNLNRTTQRNVDQQVSITGDARQGTPEDI